MTPRPQALYDAVRDASGWTPPLDLARYLARQALAECQSADIHDPAAMIRAAVSLESRLRHLLDALDAEDGAR
ncbi:hypothetical protein QCN29_26880 [Streptomyces sp. HNM0663]|uniref:Uncharacterized protein n=1 Tax=Streptomyces chengmaiensis TaxID=3040919 RepID=A0ABT6HUE9_9ACTN|nr:hypothetical protein [Streptomyces chengmaiensis]MDH2392337.1 hypothetical protein [Streptomyces chengmaiensis]